jgi:hypothetical protein
MEDNSEIYGADIFGSGNGVLHIAVTHEIDESGKSWDITKGDRWLNVCLDDEDLEAVSLEVFRLATGKPYDGSDNILKLRNHDRQLFARLAPEFPMLSRVNYIYEDVFFNVEEVALLRDECFNIRSVTKNSAVDLGLRKLLYSCDEALQVNLCLELSCD